MDSEDLEPAAQDAKEPSPFWSSDGNFLDLPAGIFFALATITVAVSPLVLLSRALIELVDACYGVEPRVTTLQLLFHCVKTLIEMGAMFYSVPMFFLTSCAFFRLASSYRGRNE